MSETTELISIVGTKNPSRKADLIFVHGLGGDAWSTWHPSARKDDNNFWLMWLGEDFPDVGVWSINYQVEPTKWRGSSMFLRDRATNIVDLLDVNKLGTRPIIFITHSMGGLVVKQMLCNAIYSGETSWKRIVEQTQGIVFLSTPHSGSNIANWFKYIGGILGATVSIKELEKDHPNLINLNAQYCAHELLSKIPVLVYYEGRRTRISWLVNKFVVDKESANPGREIEDIKFVELDEDHISISKPNSKGHRTYKGVRQFIEKCLTNFSENMDFEEKYGQASNQKVETTNPESDRDTRNIYINQGNYNENIHGDYVEGKSEKIQGKGNFASRLKKESLEQELAARKKDYQAVDRKYRRETHPAEKNNLRAELDELLEDIERIEQEWKKLM